MHVVKQLATSVFAHNINISGLKWINKMPKNSNFKMIYECEMIYKHFFKKKTSLLWQQ